MKKIIVLSLCLLGLAFQSEAQKYMTRTGKITFFSSTPVENIEAFNNDVSSVMDAQTGELIFIVPIKSFKFEKALMQEHFNENYMESDQFPKAEFKGKITDLSGVDFKKDGTYKVQTSGKLTIHGVTKVVTVPGTITIKGRQVTTTAKFDVRPADYGIKIPSMVASKIADKIEVTVNSQLMAR